MSVILDNILDNICMSKTIEIKKYETDSINNLYFAHLCMCTHTHTHTMAHMPASITIRTQILINEFLQCEKPKDKLHMSHTTTKFIFLYRCP